MHNKNYTSRNVKTTNNLERKEYNCPLPLDAGCLLAAAGSARTARCWCLVACLHGSIIMRNKMLVSK